MSDFSLGSSPEFAAAWKAATKDGRIDRQELKVLAKLSDASPDKEDGELVGRLITDIMGSTEGAFAVKGGAASQTLHFVEDGKDGYHALHIAPSEVTNDNVREFLAQRLYAATDKIDALDKSSPDYDKQVADIWKAVHADLNAALKAMPAKNGEISPDKAEAAFQIAHFLSATRDYAK